jgi:Lipocalin-like domain
MPPEKGCAEPVKSQSKSICAMKNKILSYSAIILFTTFASCSKDGSQPGERSVTNLSGTYSLTSLIVTKGSISTDEYPSLPDCVKGNTLTFKPELIVTFNDVAPVCDPPADSTANWSLSANTDTLYIATTKYVINSWDGTTLVLNSDSLYMGSQVGIKTTLVKQQ